MKTNNSKQALSPKFCLFAGIPALFFSLFFIIGFFSSDLPDGSRWTYLVISFVLCCVGAFFINAFRNITKNQKQLLPVEDILDS